MCTRRDQTSKQHPTPVLADRLTKPADAYLQPIYRSWDDAVNKRECLFPRASVVQSRERAAATQSSFPPPPPLLGRSDDVFLLVLGVLALHAPDTRDPFSPIVILLHPSRPREDLLSSSPQHYQYTSRYITRQSTSR